MPRAGVAVSQPWLYLYHALAPVSMVLPCVARPQTLTGTAGHELATAATNMYAHAPETRPRDAELPRMLFACTRARLVAACRRWRMPYGHFVEHPGTCTTAARVGTPERRRGRNRSRGQPPTSPRAWQCRSPWSPVAACLCTLVHGGSSCRAFARPCYWGWLTNGPMPCATKELACTHTCTRPRGRSLATAGCYLSHEPSPDTVSTCSAHQH